MLTSRSLIGSCTLRLRATSKKHQLENSYFKIIQPYWTKGRSWISKMYHKTKDSVTFNSQVQFWCKLSIGVIIFILLLTSAILQIIRNPKCFQSLLGKSSYNEGSTKLNWSSSDWVPWCGINSDQTTCCNLLLEKMSFISGLIGIPFIALFFSSDPSRIRIRPILFGLTVQVLMGVICFQFPIGRDAIQSAASVVQKGVNYSQAGAEFVFGDRFV